MFLSIWQQVVILLPDKENMVDGVFLQTRIQVERLVQHVTCEQVQCHARAAVPWSTFLGTFCLIAT